MRNLLSFLMIHVSMIIMINKMINKIDNQLSMINKIDNQSSIKKMNHNR